MINLECCNKAQCIGNIKLILSFDFNAKCEKGENMLIKKNEQNKKQIENMKGGEGVFDLLYVEEVENLKGSIRLYGKGKLEPGDSVGFHRHEDSVEICTFLSGRGNVKEDNEEYEVEPGDVSVCFVGEAHKISNTGDQDLVYTVLVVQKDS